MQKTSLLATLIEQIESDSLTAEARAAVFRMYAHDERLTAWFDRTRHAISTEASPSRAAQCQHWVRAFRASCASTPSGRGTRHLLVGWPVHAASRPGVELADRLPETVWREASDGLAYLLRDFEVKIQMARGTVSANWLDSQPPGSFLTWTELLRRGLDPFRAASRSAVGLEPGPSRDEEMSRVWVGLLTFPAEHEEGVLSLVHALTPSATNAFRPLALRVDALAEEKGVSLRMFIPTALWNAASFSRIFSARCRLSPYRATSSSLSLKTRGSLHTLQDAAGRPLEHFDFPEELPADVLFLQQVISPAKKAPHV